MQFRFLSASLAALAIAVPFTMAQDLSSLPTCAQAPALSSIASTSCQLTDFSCICKDTAFITALTPQIEKACSPADFQKVVAFTQNLCGSVGVTLSVPGVATATASSGTVLSSASVMSGSMAATTSGMASGSMTTTTASTTGAAPAATTSSGASRGAVVGGALAAVLGLGAWVVL
ncbi:hypothetical protein MMC30_002754 [Trapelia coarctata]|nr:hypothetical protein [Trapelia coarctata]